MKKGAAQEARRDQTDQIAALNHIPWTPGKSRTVINYSITDKMANKATIPNKNQKRTTRTKRKPSKKREEIEPNRIQIVYLKRHPDEVLEDLELVSRRGDGPFKVKGRKNSTTERGNRMDDLTPFLLPDLFKQMWNRRSPSRERSRRRRYLAAVPTRLVIDPIVRRNPATRLVTTETAKDDSTAP